MPIEQEINIFICVLTYIYLLMPDKEDANFFFMKNTLGHKKIHAKSVSRISL